MSIYRTMAQSLTRVVLGELVDAGRLHLPGFGVFKVRIRKARVIRDRVTGEIIQLPANVEVGFRAAKELKRAMAKGLKR